MAANPLVSSQQQMFENQPAIERKKEEHESKLESCSRIIVKTK